MQLFDLHCDSIVNFRELNSDFLCDQTQFSLREHDRFQRMCQTMAIFIPDSIRGEEAFDYFNVHCAYLKELEKKQSDLIELAYTAEDLERITGLGKCVLLLAIESGAALAGRIEHVDYFAKCGVKMMTLVWNGENELGSGHRTQHGLSTFGKQVVTRMEEKRIIVDVSHLNDPGFEEVCEIAKRPFIATHSNLRTVSGHKRNLTEKQFKEIVKRGGLVGINLHEPFLTDDGPGNIDMVYRHIAGMLDFGGEHVIACGSDFDGADVDEGLNTPVKFAMVGDYLIQKGIKEEVVNHIFFENAMTFFQKYL